MGKIEEFDIAIIGAGPGGYVAAIKAAQQNKSVALIEKNELGGTCLNCGCIPTKTLIANAEILHKVKEAENFGIQVGNVSFDYSKMKARKDSVVQGIRKSLEGLLKSNKITIFKGVAKFQDIKTLKVEGEQNVLLSAKKIIIASGSTTLDIKAFPCDHDKILNSTSALELTSLPKSIAIIGGGYIGCEFASLFAQLGVKVTILEALDKIVAMQGKTISDFLTDSFKKDGITIQTNVMVTSIEKGKDGVVVHLKDGSTVSAEKALVAIGRKIVADTMDIQKAGLTLTEKGTLAVDSKMQTEVPGIYAIGDVTGRAMLAHVASHQGIVAATNAFGGQAHMHYHAIPAVIFTHPEIATVGMTQEEAVKAGHNPKVGMFPLKALGKAQATRETEGFVQILSHPKTKEILGAQAIGHGASNIIAEMALAIQNELTLDCVIDTVHAHPTIAESWLEAALLANDAPIHFPPKIRKG